MGFKVRSKAAAQGDLVSTMVLNRALSIPGQQQGCWQWYGLRSRCTWEKSRRQPKNTECRTSDRGTGCFRTALRKKQTELGIGWSSLWAGVGICAPLLDLFWVEGKTSYLLCQQAGCMKDSWLQHLALASASCRSPGFGKSGSWRKKERYV